MLVEVYCRKNETKEEQREKRTGDNKSIILVKNQTCRCLDHPIRNINTNRIHEKKRKEYITNFD